MLNYTDLLVRHESYVAPLASFLGLPRSRLERAFALGLRAKPKRRKSASTLAAPLDNATQASWNWNHYHGKAVPTQAQTHGCTNDAGEVVGLSAARVHRDAARRGHDSHDFPVPSLYLPCTFPIPSARLAEVTIRNSILGDIHLGRRALFHRPGARPTRPGAALSGSMPFGTRLS